MGSVCNGLQHTQAPTPTLPTSTQHTHTYLHPAHTHTYLHPAHTHTPPPSTHTSRASMSGNCSCSPSCCPRVLLPTPRGASSSTRGGGITGAWYKGSSKLRERKAVVSGTKAAARYGNERRWCRVWTRTKGWHMRGCIGYGCIGYGCTLRVHATAMCYVLCARISWGVEEVTACLPAPSRSPPTL